ncbi:MAG: MFS transporter [Gammaproteobacteria bacterium]|nr:MFS transporter [Gammaproteobacteria bacterium]
MPADARHHTHRYQHDVLLRFSRSVALRIQASAAETGLIVALAQIAGIVGGLSAAPLSKRLGELKTLLITTCLHTLFIILAIFMSSVLVLGFAAFCEATLFIIMVPLMFSLAASIDIRGRGAAAAGGIFTVSTAFGPIFGALLIENSGYSSIAWLQIVSAIPALIIFILVSRKTRPALRHV